MSWTIEHVDGASEQSLEAWGVSGVVVARSNQNADTLRFLQPATAFDGEPLFAFDDTLALKRSGAKTFVGRRAEVRRVGQDGREYMEYLVVGPWSWLEQIVYQQVWKSTNGVDDTLVEERRSRIIVGQDKDGNKIDTNAEMSAALQWAIDNGAALAIGTVDAGVTIPYQELVDVTVAELIRACLRWSPDAAVWFDYTTTVPTIHIRRRANLAPVSLALDPEQAKSIEIRSREDLRVPAVSLKFVRSHSYNGETWTTTETDKYPPAATGSEPRALVATIDLEGSASNVEEQKLETEPISETSATFWKKQIPSLRAYPAAQLSITSAVIEEYDDFGVLTPSTLAKYIVEGSVQDWMSGVAAKEVTVSAKIGYTYSSSFPSAPTEPFETEFAVTLLGTDASRSRYTRTISFIAAEATPTGLAQSLYTGLGFLHWQGSFTLLEDEVSGAATPGNLLNLTGGRAEWETMGAMVQEVIESIDEGETRLVFGPPEQLAPQDLVELLRTNRTRNATFYLLERSSAQKASSGGLTTGAQKTLRQNTTAAPNPTGSSGRFIGFSLTSSGSVVPSKESIASDIEGAYSDASLAPQSGDFLVSTQFVFVIGPSSPLGGSYPGESFSSVAISVGGISYRAHQIGPHRLFSS